MAVEQIEIRPLSESEQILKEAYETGDKSLWETPMSFSQYEQYEREGRIAQTPTSRFYREKSRGGRGITLEEAVSSTQVYVVSHLRYSYPVLHNHDYVEIVYVARGSCVNLFENSSFPMKAGDICILAPHAMHALSCVNDDSCILNMLVNRRFFDKRFLNILHGGKLMAEYLEGILFERDVSPYVLFPTGEDPWLQAMAAAMLGEIEEQEYAYETALSLLVAQFLLRLVRRYEASAVVPNKSGSTQNELIVGILSYLNVHYSQTSLNETARYFGYSPAYLSRMIREQTGKNFNTIIAQIQVEQAVRQMNAGKTNLTEIAQEIGCFDTSHFNKKFKAVYGMSPRQYLEQRLSGR